MKSARFALIRNLIRPGKPQIPRDTVATAYVGLTHWASILDKPGRQRVAVVVADLTMALHPRRSPVLTKGRTRTLWKALPSPRMRAIRSGWEVRHLGSPHLAGIRPPMGRIWRISLLPWGRRGITGKIPTAPFPIL